MPFLRKRRYLKGFVLGIFLLFSKQGICGLSFDVGVIFQKGVGKDLTLKSEVYTTEEQFGTLPIEFVTSNQIKIKITSKFKEDSSTYGPSSLLNVETMVGVVNQQTKIFESDIYLNEKKEFSFFQGEDQLIKVEITPRSF